MFVACSHRGGLNCNGVIVQGPAPPLPPSASPDLPRPRMIGAYAITQIRPDNDPAFLEWASQNARSTMITQGIIVWAESDPALQLALFEGRRTGRFVSPTWAQAADHVPAG